MVICNITWNVASEAFEQWKDWLLHRWLPALQELNATQLHFCRLLHQTHDGLTFTQQVAVHNMQAYTHLIQSLQPELQYMMQLLGTSVVYFQSVMEEISL